MVNNFKSYIPILNHLGYKNITDEDGWSFQLTLYKNNTYYILDEDGLFFYVVNEKSPYCSISKIPGPDFKNLEPYELDDYTFNYEDELERMDSSIIFGEVISYNRKIKIKNII